MIMPLPFPKQTNKQNKTKINSSKLKKFADDNSKFDENGRKFAIWVENSNFSLSHIVFKRLILQTRKTQDLFGKWLNVVLMFC